MTREEKDLFLADLCARLPYGVKCQVQEDEYTYIGTLCRIEIDNKKGHLLDFVETICGLDCQAYLTDVQPYLLPLSSMTEEQRKYINNRWGIDKFDFAVVPNWQLNIDICDARDYINWLNKNHFDYRGLIEKGFAIDCTNLDIY